MNQFAKLSATGIAVLIMIMAGAGAPNLLSASGGGDGLMAAENDPDAAVAGELLVKFDNAVSAEQANTAITNVGGEVVNVMLDGSLYLVRFAYAETVPDIKRALEKTPGVAYVELNYKVGIEPPVENGSGSTDGGKDGPITIE